MIKCHEVSKYYGEKTALDGLTFEQPKGEVLGLLGINGAGKSTLIKIILDLIRPDNGTVTLQTDMIGYMPELASMPETVSPLALLRFGWLLRCNEKQGAESSLEEINLSSEAWRKPIRQLSKGMRQRTALAFALIGMPPLLILDEPMSGLDAIGRLHLINILAARHEQGSTILICSHIVPDLVRLSQRVLLMGQGRVLDEFNILNHDMSEVVLLEKLLANRSMA